MPLPIHEKWNEDARKMLVGRTITDARYMTTEDAKREGWGRLMCGSLVLTLSDGTQLFPSTDDEGNGPGALFVRIPGKPRRFTFPVCTVRGDFFSDGTPVNTELPPGACGECDECEQGNRCRELPEPDEEDCALCGKQVGETCECFICADCGGLALGSECRANKNEGMYCKDCSKEENQKKKDEAEARAHEDALNNECFADNYAQEYE